MHPDFPLSHLAGSDTSKIDSRQMQQHAAQRAALTPQEQETLLQEHARFLASGGSGGKWRAFVVGGVVFGVYQGKGSEGEGKQAALDMLHLPASLDWQECELSYASFVGCHAKNVNFSDSHLRGSLFCDAYMERAIFADAQLQHADFSRACLRYASFMNADLTGADFENADLTGADFTGAILTDARFPGARLYQVRR